MYHIEQITSDAVQKQKLVLADGSFIDFTIEFKPMQYGWFIRELTYGDFTLSGARIVVSPNMLRQFRDKLPFGLACFSAGDREPSQLEDFSSGTANLYILSEDEVDEYEEYLVG